MTVTVTSFGHTLMTEQSGPKDLVRWTVEAERAGFDFEVGSDHYSPWLTEQGHTPYAWSVLGAIAQATEGVGLMTYVNCPTIRYDPAVVAQKSATLQLLADGRFTLGLGSGGNLNEHVVGQVWPGVDTRQAMLVEAIEAIEIIRELHGAGLVTYRGEHFDVDSARLGHARPPGRDRGGRRRQQGRRALRPVGRPPHRDRARRRPHHLLERTRRCAEHRPGRTGDRPDPDQRAAAP